MNSELDSILVEAAAGGEVWYQPNPGNAGDALLAVAARQKFRQLGIHANAIPAEFDAAGKVVVFGGGGNLVPLYHDASDFIARHAPTARRLVILPHSVDGHEDILSALGPNAVIFCRERRSHEHCLAHAKRASVHLAHDLAFDLDVERLRPFATRRELLAYSVRQLGTPALPWAGRLAHLRKTAGVLRRLSAADPARGPLLAMRGDAESAGERVPNGNLDISELFTLLDTTGADAELSARLFLGWISRYSTVTTDRLHVAIAGALLGKTVSLRPNSYYKCAAVWEHSIRGRFPGVQIDVGPNRQHPPAH